MKFGADDFYAGTEFIQNFLQLGFGIILDLSAVAGNDVLHFGLADNFAQDGLGSHLYGAIGALHAEKIIFGAFDFPDDCQIDIDNIFIAGHMWLSVKELGRKPVLRTAFLAPSERRCWMCCRLRNRRWIYCVPE